MYIYSSFGWKPRRKRKEMADPRLVYIIATKVNLVHVRVLIEQENVPVGFVSFMFDDEQGRKVSHNSQSHDTTLFLTRV